MTDLETLLQWATPLEVETVQAYIQHGTWRKAARALGVKEDTAHARYRKLKKRAARMGHSPEADLRGHAADGYHVGGKSLYGTFTPDGKFIPTRGWVKTKEDKSRALLEALEGLIERVDGLAKPIKAPKVLQRDLMTVYAMGDPHIGMYAWAAQSGQDFNLEIATRELYTGMDLLAARVPSSTHAVIVNEGDFFHFDTFEKITNKSKHVLDAAANWEEMVDAGLDLMVRLIYVALQKHKTVHVINAKGNHDDHTSYMLAKYLSAYFRNDKRVTIDLSPTGFYYHQWGNILIASAHGNNPKRLEDLPEIMARDCADIWEDGQHRVWYTGHVHHKSEQDFRICTVKTSRTLAPGNRWSHQAGYRGFQDVRADVYHRQYGPRGNHIVGIDEIRDVIAA